MSLHGWQLVWEWPVARFPNTNEFVMAWSPRHVDTDVRFRTTYFFRVFDFCPPLRRDYAEGASGIGSGASTSRAPADEVFSPGTSRLLILTDSLYRFRMTGKANALTTQIHFESGTLRASEIDPFGFKRGV